MKSWDLIHRTHKIINITDLSPKFAEIGCAWAPETIYDPVAKKLMIYFTMRYKNERNRLYYMYVNEDFDKIETEPQLLFEYPIENKTAIDGDICYAQGKYHLFYVAHDGTPGIKQATSDFEHFKQLGRFNEGGVMFSTNFTQPKHGAVVHLTKKGAKKFAKQWDWTTTNWQSKSNKLCPKKEQDIYLKQLINRNLFAFSISILSLIFV